MSFTNMVLGGNWDRSEWPDRIEVSHEGAGDPRPYVPERTCRNIGGGEWGFKCSECGGHTHGSAIFVIGHTWKRQWHLGGATSPRGTEGKLGR